MGNACHCQQFANEKNQELMLRREQGESQKLETISISQQHDTKKFKKDIYRQDDDEEVDEQQSQNQQLIEHKRGDKKKKANMNGVSDAEEIFENILKADKPKSPLDYQLILNVFKDHFIFKSVPQSEIEYVINHIFYCTVPDGQFVFRQGSKASCYFLIERGQCQLIVNGEHKKTLISGQSFGELDMLYNVHRSATIRAYGDCAFWAIDKTTFRKVVEQQNSKNYEENRVFMKRVEFFSFLTKVQRDAICNVLITLSFKKGEIIVSEGDVANSFYVIKKGKVSIIKGGKEVSQMNAGESFGEAALQQSCRRAATVKAIDEDVICLSLSKDDIQKILGQKIQTIKYLNTQRWAFQQNPILGKLTSIQVEKIFVNIKQNRYEKNEIILKAGQPCLKVYIVLEGEMALIPSNKYVFDKGKIFGDQLLKSQNNDNKMIENLQVRSDEAIIAEFEIKVFLYLIGGDVEQMIQNNENSHEHKYFNRPNAIQQNDYSNINLENLIHLKKLGQGQFGVVHLVRTANENKLFALKCVNKNQIVEQGLKRYFLADSQALQSINFPFIMQFYKSMQDEKYIYILLEFIKGLSLFDVIRDIGLLNSKDSQFYIAQLLLCVEYFQKSKIIYRDIKPENIMVDHKGYMKLINTSFVKFLNKGSKRTFTILGTPHYQAIEIFGGQGYNFSANLWSIGICLYEFMCGCVPYGEETDDSYEVYQEIKQKPLIFPKFMNDRKAKLLIEQLLSKIPEVRLGGSFAALKANDWFDNFDWDRLMDRELHPPYIPKKDSMINNIEINSGLQNGRLISQEMNGDTERKGKARDSNWDTIY